MRDGECSRCVCGALVSMFIWVFLCGSISGLAVAQLTKWELSNPQITSSYLRIPSILVEPFHVHCLKIKWVSKQKDDGILMHSTKEI